MPSAYSSLEAARQDLAKQVPGQVVKLDFTQSEIDRLKAKLLTLSDATIIVRSPERDENGRCKYVEVANVAVQLAATVKALEFGVGKPRQMIEVSDGSSSNAHQPGIRDLAHLLHRNPEITAKVISALKDGVNFSQAIPVQEVKHDSPAQPPESQSGGSPSESAPTS